MAIPKLILDHGEAIHHLFDCAIDGLERVLGPPVHCGLNFLQRCDVAAYGLRGTADDVCCTRRDLLMDRRKPTFVLLAQLPQLRQQLVHPVIGPVPALRLSVVICQLLDKGADALIDALEHGLAGGRNLNRFQPVGQGLDDGIDIGRNRTTFVRTIASHGLRDFGQPLLQRIHEIGIGRRPAVAIDLVTERFDLV